MAWEKTSSSSVANVLNALKIPGPYSFMFGRASISGKNVLGKIIASNGIFSFEAVTASGAVKMSDEFEVLTCRTSGCGEHYQRFEKHKIKLIFSRMFMH